MTEAQRKHHGQTTTRSDREPPPEPTHAERARTLLVQALQGAVATQCQRHPGFPFASLMPYALDEEGRPIILVSRLAVHTQNLERDDRASLLVTEPELDDRNPLGLARVTLLGRFRDAAEEPNSAGGAREAYLARHPESAYWVDYPDFGFRRMDVENVYYVGGFGVMGWVTGEDYRLAEPDPLRDAARSIIDHMNDDHADALALLARAEGLDGVEEAVMTAVDRLGFHLRVRTAEGMRGTRIGFSGEARDASRVRELLVAQVQEARKALVG